MEMSLPVLLFQGIPASIALSIFVLAINNSLKENWKSGIILGSLLGIFVYITRLLPLAFGTHTLVFISAYVILFRVYYKFKSYKIIKGVLLGFLIITFSEIVSFVLLPTVLNSLCDQVIETSFWIIILGWLQIIFLLLASFLMTRKANILERKKQHV
ncbi:hypothetical protein [Natranaerobius trueperi]|uniref:Uncharacterized protein n=1 Tax=Natranaerobius trueperi TaxID=759412 RepID=A0A226C1G2_9FIRM|nr:hypothetical protein [Natranaerobius trueperi]OWZ84862.1 hypothetical protein CDO51_00190 [Natranaerobius trueperi]